LWPRISLRADDGEQTFGHMEARLFLIMIDRGDYWQCAFVIPKGAAETWRKKDIAELRGTLLGLSPFLKERVNEIGSRDDVKLLTVAVDRLPQWYQPGLLCIGAKASPASPTARPLP
jgi:hypothetical protein